MRRLIGAALATLLACGVAAAAPQKGPAKARKNPKQERTLVTDRRDVGVHIVFGSSEVTILRNHYYPQYRNLPPGLQKKVARGKPLPPGWQKKLQPFPVGIERQLGPLPRGYRRGVVDGHAVIVDSRTDVIVDVAVLF
jgi:hypothetical protein